MSEWLCQFIIQVSFDDSADGHLAKTRTEVEVRRMDRLTPEIERLFAAKQERRLRLAALPFHEKVKAVVRLQEMVAPELRKQGKQVRVWVLEQPLFR